MIRYYKLFDLLNRRGMNKSDLLDIISSKTIAKLSKGANLQTDVIDKICIYLGCQPSDIMEVITEDDLIDQQGVKKGTLIEKNVIDNEETPVKETYVRFGNDEHETLIDRELSNS